MRPSRALSGASVGVVAALVVALGCSKKALFSAGDPCQPGRVECISGSVALVCGAEGTFVSVPCRGKGGCVSQGALATCDRSTAEPGDACEGDDGRTTCTSDGRRALLCRSGKLETAFECPTFDCHVSGKRAECTRAFAKEGAPCTTEGDTVCAEDERSLLVCRGKVTAKSRLCHGKNGCKGARNPACDDTLASPGDPCTLSGQVVCSEDETTELVCQNGRFTTSRSCPKAGCRVENAAQKRISCR
ncbi:MAG: hypothetical protein JNM74_02860 [Myxococcales bacterium]|nr:hypothetical protein [Myxococcales bacterium]